MTIVGKRGICDCHQGQYQCRYAHQRPEISFYQSPALAQTSPNPQRIILRQQGLRNLGCGRERSGNTARLHAGQWSRPPSLPGWHAGSEVPVFFPAPEAPLHQGVRPREDRADRRMAAQICPAAVRPLAFHKTPRPVKKCRPGGPPFAASRPVPAPCNAACRSPPA